MVNVCCCSLCFHSPRIHFRWFDERYKLCWTCNRSAYALNVEVDTEGSHSGRLQYATHSTHAHNGLIFQFSKANGFITSNQITESCAAGSQANHALPRIGSKITPKCFNFTGLFISFLFFYSIQFLKRTVFLVSLHFIMLHHWQRFWFHSHSHCRFFLLLFFSFFTEERIENGIFLFHTWVLERQCDEIILGAAKMWTKIGINSIWLWCIRFVFRKCQLMIWSLAKNINQWWIEILQTLEIVDMRIILQRINRS